MVNEHSVVLTQDPLHSFLSAGFGQMLVDVCRAQGGQAVVPRAVLKQMTVAAEADPALAPCDPILTAMVSVKDLVILDVDLEDEMFAAAYGRIADLAPARYRNGVVDVSPAIALAHTLTSSFRDEDARLLTDDWRHQEHAGTLNLDVLRTPDILLAGAHHGMIANPGKARAMYERLQDYNLQLVPWNSRGPLNDPQQYR